MAKKKTTKKAVTKKKGGPISKDRKKTIVENLTKLVESGQVIGVTNSQLAKQFNTRRQTIAIYLKDIYENIPAEDINSTRVKIQVMFDRLFREVHKMINKASSDKDKKEAIELLLKMVDKFTDFLEKFHVKPKAVDNVVVQGEMDHKLEIEVVVPDYMKTIPHKKKGKK